MAEERYLSLKSIAQKKKVKLEPLVEVGHGGDLTLREFRGEWYARESEIPKLLALGGEQEKHQATQSFLFQKAYQLLLLITIIFVGQFFWQARGWQPLALGAKQTLTALTTLPQLQNNTLNIFSDVAKELIQLWFTLEHFWQTLISNFDYGREKVVSAWRQFLNRSPPPTTNNELTPPINGTPDVPASGIDPALLAELRAEIKAELAKELGNRSQLLSGPMSTLPTSGLVTLPASGNASTDAATLSRLENAFSDQVEVKFEPSRQAGMITPVFKTGRGDNYLFVITPINRNTP